MLSDASSFMTGSHLVIDGQCIPTHNHEDGLVDEVCNFRRVHCMVTHYTEEERRDRELITISEIESLALVSSEGVS